MSTVGRIVSPRRASGQPGDWGGDILTGKGDEMLNEESMETIKPVPQRRIVDKMNEYMSRRDYAGAERHLLYWLAEAELGRDLQGQLMLRNEMVGHYRKTAQREKAMESAGKALELLRELGMEDSISAGTTYVNIATACNAFGEYERSLELFEKAALSKYDEALDLYEKAIAVMAKVQDGELEQAITCLNMADALEAGAGMEEGESRIFELVECAEELLDNKGRELLRKPDGDAQGRADDGRSVLETPGALKALPAEERARIGYYAFVCEKCAPVFEYYGYFLTANKLRDRLRGSKRQIERRKGLFGNEGTGDRQGLL